MASVPIDIVFNITSSRSVISKDCPVEVDIDLIDGDIMTCRVQLIKSTGRSISVISGVGLSCQLAVAATRGGTVLTSASAASSADSSDFWTVVLPVNTTLIAGVATATGAPVFIEALIGTQRFQIPARLYKQVNSGTVGDAPVQDVAIGKLEAGATYVAKNGDAGTQQIFTSLGGTKVRMYAGDDGEMHWEIVS